MNGVRIDLLRALGPAYLADAVAAQIRQSRQVAAWRGYVADALFALCGFAGGGLGRRFVDGSDDGDDAAERLEGWGVRVGS